MCQSSGRSEVTGANVLVAIFSEQESRGILLKKNDISRLDIVNCFARHYKSKQQATALSSSSFGGAENAEEANSEDRLENFATNSNEVAKQR